MSHIHANKDVTMLSRLMRNRHISKISLFFVALTSGIFCYAVSVSAQENGFGPDLDGDSNPATDVHGFFQDQKPPEVDPRFEVIDFEPPIARHDATISKDYETKFGVTFSRGLKFQECAGQQYFTYDTKCTYLLPTSGQYAALYHDDYRRPLRVRFDTPVCATALAIYPVGGKEGEPFKVTLDLYKTISKPSNSSNKYIDQKIGSTDVEFEWTENTFRWRSKIFAFLEKGGADRIDISIRSLAHRRRSNNVDLLIDDLAFVRYGNVLNPSPCGEVLSKLKSSEDDTGDEDDAMGASE
ncbi:MAG: hypothetical protein AAF720_00490 [Pseudomonadota bacterium]